MPDSGPKPDVASEDGEFYEESEVHERSYSGTASSDEKEEVFGAGELDFLDAFGTTPSKKSREPIDWDDHIEIETSAKEEVEQIRRPKFVNVAQPSIQIEEEEEVESETQHRFILEKKLNVFQTSRNFEN